MIVIGHTRWRAAKHLGLTEVPVHVADGLSPEQIKALRIADNKTGEVAEWDLDKLAIELKALEGGDLDLDLAALGFDQDELAKLLDPGVSTGLTDPDDVPLVPDVGQTRTRPGDLWLLGDHRLVCGDSAEPEHVTRLMNGEQADLLLTDPPYNVAYEGGTDAAMAMQEWSWKSRRSWWRLSRVSRPRWLRAMAAMTASVSLAGRVGAAAGRLGMGGSVGVLRALLPMHIGDIQSRSDMRNQCIISAAGPGAEAQMSLAKSPTPDVGGVRLTALSIDHAATLLRRSGSQRASVEALRADVAAGAPLNPDGTINLIAYGAWLVRSLANRESPHGG